MKMFVFLTVLCIPFATTAVYAQDISLEVGQLPEDTEVINVEDTEIVPPVLNDNQGELNSEENTSPDVEVQKKEEMKMPSGEPTMEDMMDRIKLNIENVDEKTSPISSLFFTAREHALLVEARRGYVTRPPGEEEIDNFNPETPVMGPRVLELGGIVYLSSNDWVVWLNGQRVTQNAIPPEVLDIKVRKEYIQLQWFDEFTNQIFPVKLRSNQRFNIDSRIFLPGE